MTQAERLYHEGHELERQGKLEEAFQKYDQAAALNDTDAMIGIARLYLSGEFRPVEHSNLSELLLGGGPIFPWSMRTEKRPDSQSALKWLIRAADLGNAQACETAGCMLCSGIGCKEDVEKGIAYLEKAAASGKASARNFLCLFRPNGKQLTDEEYEACLSEFEKAADAGDDRVYELYATLKSGSQKQLARLGKLLISAQNIQRKGYEEFQYSFAPSGIPLLPVAAKRGAWKTFLRFNLDAWTEKYPLIAVSSDILSERNAAHMLRMFHHAEIVGKAEYRSPAFGWLDEQKDAVLIRLGTDSPLDAEGMDKVITAFRLIEEEYQGDSIAFMVETGEKEYSFEVTGIDGNKVEVLWRYTVGGSDQVRKYFEPELISIEMNE